MPLQRTNSEISLGTFENVIGAREEDGKDSLVKAFRKYALAHHPDRNPGQDPNGKEATFFKRMCSAFEKLKEGKLQRTTSSYKFSNSSTNNQNQTSSNNESESSKNTFGRGTYGFYNNYKFKEKNFFKKEYNSQFKSEYSSYCESHFKDKFKSFNNEDFKKSFFDDTESYTYNKKEKISEIFSNLSPEQREKIKKAMEDIFSKNNFDS